MGIESLFDFDIRSLRLRVVSVVVLFLYSVSYSQIDHYWGQVYNPESALLAGAVVSGNGEAGAVYYNPATLSFVENSAFSVNVNLLSLQRYHLKDAVGEDLEKTQFVLQPRFLGFMLESKKLEDFVFEAVYLNRNNHKLDLLSATSTTIDVLEYPKGEENYTGNYSYQLDYNERLYGIGGAKKLSDRFSLGTSVFAVYKSSKTFKEVITTASPHSEEVEGEQGEIIDYYFAKASTNERLKYSNYRLLMKVGANYQSKVVGVGLNVTLPSVHVKGSGAAYKEFVQSNIGLPSQNELTKEILVIDGQESVKVNYKDPLAIALGGHYIHNRSLYTFSVEYFAGIEEYKAVIAEENPNSTTREEYEQLVEKDFLSAYHAAKSVLNFALGHKRYLNENMLLFTGFRTDYSSNKPLSNRNQFFSVNSDFLSYNVYHMSLGTSLKLNNTQLVFGVQYSLGREKGLEQLANFTTPYEYNYEEGVALQGDINNTMEFRYNAVSLYIGVTYSFIRKLTGSK